MSDGPDPAEFEALRPLLFTVAYEMLEVAADAEDVVQEAWLRWSKVDPGTVRDDRAYLVRIVTRLSLNRLRTLARRRESYVGPWLPEPLVTAPDVAEDVELADSLSTAMLLVMETLTPTERAVFVLREVFAFDYAEVAEAVGKNPAVVRQIAHRAREHVAARRPRGTSSREQTRGAMAAFQRAIETGDMQVLFDVLAPDVVLMTDGGGKVQAALNPIRGRDKVLRFLAGVTPDALELEPVWLNGSPGIQFVVDGQRDGVGTMLVEDGVVTRLFLVRNPDKLGAVGTEVGLGR